MVRHNNMVPLDHFHKKWQPRVKTWFDQPMKKIRRKRVRTKRLARLAPRPIQRLRPMVHCPSVRYHSKMRAGRGFTIQELKKAGINPSFAKTIGISVDHRRRNRCVESLAFNVQRLKEYQQRLILIPDKSGRVVKTDPGRNLNKVPMGPGKVKARRVTEEEKKFGAYVALRRARCDAKFAGVRLKRKMSKSDVLDPNRV